MSYKLDAVDLKILNSLAKDTRKTVTQIAIEVEISRPTVMKRLKKLTESNVLDLGGKVNVTKLQFKLGQMALKAKSPDAKQQLEKRLVNCPRVLFLMETSGNPHYLALLYGEDTETLVSTVESFKSFSGTEVVSWHRSKPPLKMEAFDLRIFLKKSKLAPCGKRCSDCYSYQNSECLGCPAVTEYKGPL